MQVSRPLLLFYNDCPSNIYASNDSVYDEINLDDSSYELVAINAPIYNDLTMQKFLII